MAKKPNDRGAKLLKFGLGLMSQEGLSGVTLGRLAQNAGMSKSGVFAHFSSKAEVQIALLDYSSQFGAAWILEPTMSEPPGMPRLRALIRNWFGWAGRAGLPGGCPVAAAMFELDDVEGPVRDKVMQLDAEWRGLLAQITSDAVAKGELRADLELEQFVFELCGIYLAHHVSSRFNRDPRADQRANTAVDALLERAQPVH